MSGVFIDKSPDMPLVSSLPLIQIMYPEARVIFMKRHGVTNVESKLRRFPEQTFENHCLFWKQTMDEWLKVRNELKHFIEVDQGQLWACPEECSAQIAEFLELTDTQRNEMLTLFTERHIEKTSSEMTISKKVGETSWSTDEKESFIAICGKTMIEYGYDY